MLLTLVGRCRRWLGQRWFRPAPLALADLDPAAWRDLGLSPADGPALVRGCYLDDASRRQR
jgi:hypothetical protein